MEKAQNTERKIPSDLIDEFSDDQLGPIEDLFSLGATSRVLDFFLIFDEFDYSEADIRRGAVMSQRQLYRILPKLVSYGIIEFTRKSGKSKMYRLNKNSEMTVLLKQLAFLVSKKRLGKIETWSEAVTDMQKINSIKQTVENDFNKNEITAS